jgi:methionyl-tRNA formyltransferase
MAERLRIAFAGTPAFAVPSLQALLDSRAHDLVAVYTQPDRPAGRGRRLTASPVKQLALDHGLTVHQPQTLRDPGAQAEFEALRLDLLVVVAYGLILPRAILDAPRLGVINVHASILPRWRGAAPIERAILAGDGETGVTLMEVEPALDAGPILAIHRCPIGPRDTAGDLHDRLATMGAALLVTTVADIAAGRARPEAQDESLVTYAAKIDKRETELDWRQPAVELDRRIRAFQPRWGTSVLLAGETVRIIDAVIIDDVSTHLHPGSIKSATADGIDVETGQGVLRLLTLQSPGKRPVSAADYLNGHPALRTSGDPTARTGE